MNPIVYVCVVFVCVSGDTCEVVMEGDPGAGRGAVSQPMAHSFMDNYMAFVQRAAHMHRSSGVADGVVPGDAAVADDLQVGSPGGAYTMHGGLPSMAPYPSFVGSSPPWSHGMMPAHGPPYPSHASVGPPVSTRGSHYLQDYQQQGRVCAAAGTEDATDRHAQPLDMSTTDCGVLDLSVCTNSKKDKRSRRRRPNKPANVPTSQGSVDQRDVTEEGKMCMPCLSGTGLCTEGHGHCGQVRGTLQ